MFEDSLRWLGVVGWGQPTFYSKTRREPKNLTTFDTFVFDVQSV